MKLLGFVYFSYFLVCALSQSTGHSDLICSPQPVAAELEMTAMIGSREPVKGEVGEDVILPCYLKPPFDVNDLTVEWRHNESNTVHVYRSLGDDLNSQHQQFKGRTSLFRDELVCGNISLKLTNVTKNDAGNYTCYVRKQHSLVRKGNLPLEVVQERPDETSKGERGDDKGPLIGGITGGVVGLVLLLVLVAVLFWKHREETRERQRQENPEEGEQLRGRGGEPRRDGGEEAGGGRGGTAGGDEGEEDGGSQVMLKE